MRKLIAAVILIVWPTCFVLASVNASGTITSAGTFQQVFAANSTRTGCTIQNNAVVNRPMYVYAGLAGAATLTNSYQVASVGGTFNCSNGGFGIQTDAIFINGTTTGDAFYAEQW